MHDLIATIEAGDPSLAPAGGAADALHIGHRAFCLSNPTAPDCPIVYCSPGFARLTGYEAHSVIGRNCRFLQVTSVTPFLSPWLSPSHTSLPFVPLPLALSLPLTHLYPLLLFGFVVWQGPDTDRNEAQRLAAAIQQGTPRPPPSTAHRVPPCPSPHAHPHFTICPLTHWQGAKKWSF